MLTQQRSSIEKHTEVTCFLFWGFAGGSDGEGEDSTRVRAGATCGLIKYGSEPNPAERQSPGRARLRPAPPRRPGPFRPGLPRESSADPSRPQRGTARGTARAQALPGRSVRPDAAVLSPFLAFIPSFTSPPRGEWVVVLFPQSDANLFCRRFHCQLRPLAPAAPPPPAPPYLPHLENSQTTPRCCARRPRPLPQPSPRLGTTKSDVSSTPRNS